TAPESKPFLGRCRLIQDAKDSGAYVRAVRILADGAMSGTNCQRASGATRRAHAEVLTSRSRCVGFCVRAEAATAVGGDRNINQAGSGIERHLRGGMHLYGMHRNAFLRRIERVGVEINFARLWI